MSKIFIAPRSNETSYKNFLSTIENGIDYLIIEPHLPNEGKKILSTNKKLYAWGNKETKKPSHLQNMDNNGESNERMVEPRKIYTNLYS